MTTPDIKEHLCILGGLQAVDADLKLSDLLLILRDTHTFHEYDAILSSIAEYVLPILEEEEKR